MCEDTGDTEYDVGLCDSVSGKTNACNRCDEKLLNGLKILGSENVQVKKKTVCNAYQGGTHILN